MYFQDLTLKKLTDLVKDKGKPAYNAKNLFRWFYKRGVRCFSDMTDVAKELRSILSQELPPYKLNIAEIEKSKDGCVKFLFQLQDGETIESVLIPKEERLTLCVSTQVGCKMACKFCCTAKQGFTRDLLASEIVAQIDTVNSYARDELKYSTDDSGVRSVTNIVFMGMGEPLDNMQAVLDCISIISDDNGLAFGMRKLTVSTCGLIPKIPEFKDLCGAKLAISLNAVDDEFRSKIMPINKKYPLKDLITCLKRLALKKHEFITIEYILFEGLNDSRTDAEKLSKLLKGINIKVNLIPFNGHDKALGFKTPGEKTLIAFYDELVKNGVVCNVRHSRGTDINAACGQLKSKGKGI